MSENLQNLLREALLNNSYDYKPMHNTIKKTWMNSFSYLYSLQKAQVEYEELFYVSNDENSRNSKLIGGLYLDKFLRVSFDIDYDLIRVFNREEFRTSKFYSEEFTIKDMIYYTDIFTKLPIIIIDDQVIWDYKITITKDCTRFILPFKKNFIFTNERNPETDEPIYKTHNIKVLIIDNSFYQRFTMNKSNLYFNKDTKTIKINENLINQMNTEVIRKDTETDLLSEWKLTNINEMNNNQSYSFQKEYNRRLKTLQIPQKDGIMMCSIHFPNIKGKEYELGTQIIPFEYKDGEFIAYLTDDIVNKIIAHNLNVYISIWFIERLYHHKFYTGLTKTVASGDGADLLVVQKDELIPYKTPIPVENFMVFKKTEGTGFLLKKNNDMLEMFYPNIYHIKDSELRSGDEYDIYYFYYDSSDFKYTVLFDFYYSFLIHLYGDKSIENIINDIYYNKADLSMYTADQKDEFKNIFEKILDYKYFNHQYGETDFLHRYLPIPGNNDKEPVEYKIETLKEWIRVEPWVLRDYVLDQNKLGASYHLFTNTIDLSTRIRYSTEEEIGTPSMRFDEPRYVFAFNNEQEYPILLSCRVFVDGILVGDLYQERHLFMDYLYIPMDMVTDDSYIEIEIFPGYEYEKDIYFTTERDTIKVIGNTLTILYDQEVIDEGSINMNDDLGFVDEHESIDINDVNKEEDVTLKTIDRGDIFPTISDVYLLNEDKTEIYEKDKFDFTIHYPQLDAELINGESGTNKPIIYTRLSSFSIKPHDEELLRKPLHLKITKIPRTIRFIAKRQGYAYIELADNDLILDTEYMRVYKNGRLMSQSKFIIKSVYNRPRILFLDWFKAGDIIYIDITPYRYKEIYYQEELSKDDTLIDLRSIINKPFDIRYYDVYINGRKLSLNNVFSITPWQMTLVNLKSNYNLVIYERERDWEYFGLDYNENIYYYTLDDLLKSGVVSDNIKNEIIKEIIDKNKDPRLNIYPNTNEEEKIDPNGEDLITVNFYLYYYDRLLPFSYMNPDILQEDEEFISSVFEDIYNSYLKSSYEESETEIEKERRKDYPKVICLDPDLHFCAEGGPGPQLVFEVGHMTDDIKQKYLEDYVEIPKDGNINKK